MTKKAVKKKRPGLAPVKKIFTAPENPATWRPTPLQMDIYLEICSGVAPWKIARRLKTTTTQLQEMCDLIDDFYVSQSISDIRSMRQRMAKRLESLYETAKESFELSKQPAKTTESGHTANGSFSKEKITERAAGDSSFLAIMRQAYADIRELMALDKRTADEPGGDENRVVGETYKEALLAEFERMRINVEAVTGEKHE